jgi:VWFA-related protein
MTRRVVACAAVCGALVLTAAGQEQPPVFRAASNLVAVPVSVEDGNTPVTGLTAADFEIRDNGVVQTIELVAGGTSPVDLTVVVDTSGWVAEWEMEQFGRDVERLPDLLESGDRVRVLAFDFSLRAVVPWASADQQAAVLPMASGRPATLQGRATLNDAIAASLMASRVAGRRHVVAVLIGGVDNLISGVDASRVVDLAGRADVALYTYQRDMTRWNDRGVMAGVMGAGGNLRSTMPVRITRAGGDRMRALEQAAEHTGGRPLDYKNSAFSSLRDLVEDFRRSYVLYFRPSGAADAAWHDLRVEVRRSGADRYTVRARSGYMRVNQDLTRPGAAMAAVGPDASSVPESTTYTASERRAVTADMLPSLLERYHRGDYSAVVGEFRSASNVDEASELLRREGQRWIEEAESGSASRRRAVAAALALEIGGPTYPLPDWSTSREGRLAWREHRRPLFLWGAALLVESVRVSDVERTWYLAAIASLQGKEQFRHDMGYRRETEGLLAQAIARVPDEGRHRWTDARVVEQWLESGVQAPRMKPDEVRNAYEAAASRADDDLRAEMQLHLVSRFLGANRATDEALGPIVDPARREAAQEALARTAFAEGLTGDDFLVYMSRFFRGRLHDRLDQRPEAEAAYRAALEVFPRAQSASMPLATLLFLRGEEAEARRLVDAVLASPGAEDPWRVYFLQDYRRLPLYIEQMRAALTSSR